MADERKVMLLTGASRGIGHATVQRFAKGGWRVITCSRHPFPEKCPWGGGREDHIQIDLASPKATMAAVEEIRSRLDGKLHALVNNAGISPKAEGGGRLNTLETDLATWGQVFHVNFFSSVILARGLKDELAAAKGAIVNVTSIAGVRVHPSRARRGERNDDGRNGNGGGDDSRSGAMSISGSALTAVVPWVKKVSGVSNLPTAIFTADLRDAVFRLLGEQLNASAAVGVSIALASATGLAVALVAVFAAAFAGAFTAALTAGLTAGLATALAATVSGLTATGLAAALALIRADLAVAGATWLLMKSTTCGYTTLRQRLPLKMP